MGTILVLIGVVVSFIGGILLLVVAFQEDILWGVGCLFFSPLVLLFVILHWEEAKAPFLIELAGLSCMIAGAMFRRVGL